MLMKSSTLREPARKAPLHLLLRGTNFQIKVWGGIVEKSRPGYAVTYNDVAVARLRSRRHRARSGTLLQITRSGISFPAIGVIQKIGAFGEYRWGAQRKKAILGWEAVQRTATASTAVAAN